MNTPALRIDVTAIPATHADNGAPASRSRVSALDLVAATPWAIEPEMLDTIRAIALREGEGVEALQAREGRPLTNARAVTMRDGVAIVPISGPIFRYANLFTQISGATSLDVLAKDFTAALDDPAVRSIVLEIDSPGGQVTGIAEFAAQVHAAHKPVVAYVGGMAASAAYWIAAAAPRIVMSKSAMAGNIGAVLSLDTKKDPNKIEIVSSQSPNKRPDVGTDVGRAQMQRMVDAQAQVFIDDVAGFLGMTAEDVVSKFGAGDVFIAAAAVSLGMAHEVGTLEDVIASLAAPGSQFSTGARRQSTTAKGATMNLATFRAEHPGLVSELLAALTQAELTAANPALVQSISAIGGTAERERILAVEAQAMPGHEALIATLKADGKTTGPEAAVQILAAEKSVLGARAGALKTEAPAPVPNAAAPAGEAKLAADAPIEERAQAKWDKDEKLQAEFGGTFATFLAYAKGCDQAGRAW